MAKKRGKYGAFGENEEGMKGLFCGGERGTGRRAGGGLKERDKSSRVISKSCQRRQEGETDEEDED